MKTVLLAESHPATLEHLRVGLSQAGWGVCAVSDGGEALEHLGAQRPDVLVIAVDFPSVGGAHLGTVVRGAPAGQRVPILLIDKGHLGRARGVGSVLNLKANAYLADPMKLGELLGKLEVLREGARSAWKELSGLEQMLSRQPLASGELRARPLPALLHGGFSTRRDCVLVVAFRELRRRVFFLGGIPVSYDSSARQDSVAMYLAETGDLSAAQAEAVVRACSGGLRIGAALAEAGVALEGEELLSRLRDYHREKTAQVVTMREGRFALFGGDDFAGEIARVEIPALAPILEGARRGHPVRLFAEPLRPHLGEYPARTAEFGRVLPQLGLDTTDLKIAMQMNGRIALRDLLAHGRGGLRRSYSLLWFLLMAGAVSFGKEPAARAEGGISGDAEVIGPKPKKPLPTDLMNGLRDAAVKIITGSYFRVLGLDISADTEAVERAYHEVAARFHPDSYPGHDTSPIQDLLDSVLEKLAASYRVLTSEPRRKAYVQFLLSRMDTGRQARVSVDAEIALKRGEAALRRKDPRTALALFEEAVSQSPREPEYYSYLAWATYLAGDGDGKDRARAAQKLLKKALALNAYLERPMVILAIIESESGEHSQARKRLLKVLELNPSSRLARAALRKVGR